MRAFIFPVLLSLALSCTSESAAAPTTAAAERVPSPTKAAAAAKAQPIDHEVVDIDGKKVSLKDYRGKALLIVNTASECGYTPQYAELEKLYREYRDRGLVVLGFPSNDFGGQEPGTAEEIKNFTSETFDITFPLFEKLHARGPEKSPLYQALTEQSGPGVAGEVKWNFTKFLVDPAGLVVGRFESGVAPTDPSLRKAVEAALPARGG